MFLLLPWFVDLHGEQKVGERQCSGEPTTLARGGAARTLACDAASARPRWSTTAGRKVYEGPQPRLLEGPEREGPWGSLKPSAREGGVPPGQRR